MTPPPDHTKFIAGCVTAIALVSLACATALIFKGYTAELMVGIASAAGGSLGTMLAMKRNPQTGSADTNVAGDATITTAPQKPTP